MTEPNKKSPRTFQCRDVLWNRFEELAAELECSVDYLINDAMKQYARQRGVATPSQTQNPLPVQASSPSAASLPTTPHQSSPSQPSGPVFPAASPVAGSSPSQLSAIKRPPLPPLPSAAAKLPHAPAAPATVPHTVVPLGPPTIPLSPQKLPPLPGTPAAPAAAPAAPAAAPAALTAGSQASFREPLSGLAAPLPLSLSSKLTVWYQGEAFPVTRERFVIGRGKQGTDLTIRDPNVSRHHAQIEFENGQFYMVDMGSTNGVEFSGKKVSRQLIRHGDVFRVCSHELQMALS